MIWRRAAKHALAALARTGVGGVIRAARRARRGVGVRIFAWHRVVPDVSTAARTCMPSLCVSLRAFAAQIDHIARRWEVRSLEDAAAILGGAAPAPTRDVAVLTFDDGYRDLVEHASTLVAARGVPACAFVPTSVLDGETALPHDRLYALLRRLRDARRRILGSPVPDRLIPTLARADHALERNQIADAVDLVLHAASHADATLVADAIAARVGEPTLDELPRHVSWNDLDRLHARGFSIGAHGVAHAFLPLEPTHRVEHELSHARDVWARRTGRAPTAFAYPAGRWNDAVVDAARRAGYELGVTTEDRWNHRGDDPLLFGRKCLHDAHARGLGPSPSESLIAAHADGLFLALGLARPERGDLDRSVSWE